MIEFVKLASISVAQRQRMLNLNALLIANDPFDSYGGFIGGPNFRHEQANVRFDGTVGRRIRLSTGEKPARRKECSDWLKQFFPRPGNFDLRGCTKKITFE